MVSSKIAEEYSIVGSLIRACEKDAGEEKAKKGTLRAVDHTELLCLTAWQGGDRRDRLLLLADQVRRRRVHASALDTVKTINIDKFVPADSIEWIYLEKPHYLMPDDAVGNEAFAVIRDAMKADKVFSVSKLVMGGRERAVVLEPRGEGIVLWTLRFGEEVRPEENYFEEIDEKADPDLLHGCMRRYPGKQLNDHCRDRWLL